MAASKRNFTDFRAFPGAINEGKGIYEFPLLRHKDDADRTRQWQVFVRIVKDNNRKSGIDWNLLDEKQLPIKDEYFNVGDNYFDIPAGSAVEVWNESGIDNGKITRSAPTYFNEVANIGRANQRNAWQQALIYARMQYLKRQEKGGTQNTSAVKKVKGNMGAVMYFPMLAETYKNGAKHLKYPLYIQPKLDGVRCLAYLKMKDGGPDNVVIYSRTQKEFPAMDYLKNALYPYLNDLYDTDKNQSIYLDGELYKHGKKLQDISGESRNEHKRVNNDDNNDNKDDVNVADLNEYHLYDCFYPLELGTIYEARQRQLQEIFDAINENKDAPMIKPVTTIKVNNESEAVAQFNTFVANGYEGAILRNTTGVYLADPNKTGAFMRSKEMVKMKKKFTAEYEVINYTEGSKGKDRGAVIWVAKTNNGAYFNVTPKNMTYEQRYAIFAECKKHFKTKYLGRMLTVEYEDLSKNDVPQRAKSLGFRDYE